MANYHYDEAGNMAAYFIITFLALILVPLTLSLSPSKKQVVVGCQCTPCITQRELINKRERRSLLNPKFSKKGVFIIVGWALFGFLSYKAAHAKLEHKTYDPFEILGIRSGLSEKEIKSHFKKLSLKYHPDKVKATANETLEAIQNKFVDITKAYKSLTDETVRKNWELYGHPDGRQEMSMGIALPHWIIEGKNNIWVLGLYGIIFGGALPALVGRWWFGSRQRTKDGISAQSAALFFKSLKEESSMDEVEATLIRSYQWELPSKKSKAEVELDALEKEIEKKAERWTEIRQLAADQQGQRKALVLLFTHLLRIPVTKPSLQTEQVKLLLHSQLLLNALIIVASSRSWLAPTLSAMRLHAYLTQALLPGSERLRFAQLPGIKREELRKLASQTTDLDDFVYALEKKGDERVSEVKKAMETWGRIELVDATFKVIGERLVTPSSIVFLVVKLRLSPVLGKVEKKVLDAEETKARIRVNEEKDNQFLNGRNDVEPFDVEESVGGWAHAPYWPGNRKPAWWLVLGDDKSNRVVVPPMKITDVPFSKPDLDRDYRSYKLQFQAPQTIGLFTWKIYLISDTLVGEDVTRDIVLKIDDLSALNVDERQSEEDDISDPDEDTLAGQMAAMRGGKVKKRADEDSEDESSGTDDDKDSDSSSDSDSD